MEVHGPKGIRLENQVNPNFDAIGTDPNGSEMRLRWQIRVQIPATAHFIVSDEV